MDLVFSFDEDHDADWIPPATGDEARRRLEEGNARFVHFVHQETPITTEVRQRTGKTTKGAAAPKHAPFACVLSCSDARAPIELVLNQAYNDLFVVRVAGNVIGEEGLGSLEYAVQHLKESVKLVAVVGHTNCGAVKAAVDCYLKPKDYGAFGFSHSLRAVVEPIFVAVHSSAEALRERYGSKVEKHKRYADALVELTVSLNAARAAYHLRRDLLSVERGDVKVVYTVYDLTTHFVRVPTSIKRSGPQTNSGFCEALEQPSDFAALEKRLVDSWAIREILKETSAKKA